MGFPRHSLQGLLFSFPVLLALGAAARVQGEEPAGTETAWIAELKSGDWQSVEKAISSLEEKGSPEAVPALLALRQRTQRIPGAAKSQRYGRVDRALDCIVERHGPAGIAALAAALGSQDRLVRGCAASGLYQRGPSALAARTALEAALADADDSVRIRSAAALAEMGAVSVRVTEVVSTLFSSEDPAVRFWLAEAVASLGPRAAPLVPAWVQTLKARSGRRPEPMRFGEPAVSALLELLNDADPRLRVTAVLELMAVGPAAQEAVAALSSHLEDADPRVRKAAVRALGQIAPRSTKPLHALCLTLEDQNTHLFERIWAMESLARMGPAALPAVSALTSLAGGKEHGLALAAIETLGYLGRAPDGALPALRAALEAPSRNAAAHLAILRLGKTVPDALEVFRRASGDPRPGIRAVAAVGRAIVEGRPALDPSFLDLVKELRDWPQGERNLAIEAIGEIGPPAGPAVPILVTELLRPGGALVAVSGHALRKIG